MDIFQEIKKLSLKELMDATLWAGRKEWTNVVYRDPITKEKTPSLAYYSEDRGWFSFWPSKWWDIIDFIMYVYNIDKWAAINWFKKTYQIKDEEEKQEIIKQPKHEELWKEFNSFKMKTSSLIFSKWLWTRWVQDKRKADEVLKELWIFKWLFLKTDTYADVIIFPCMDHNKKIIWAKLRKSDWTKFWTVKSKTIKDSKTWLIYSDLDITKTVYICEWEADYVILKILWFKNVVWNLWWAASNVKMIWKLLIEVKEIVSFYDQDSAWLNRTKLIQESLSWNVILPKFPKKKKKKIDVNDLVDLKEVSNEIIKKENWYFVFKEIQDWIKEVQITNFFMTLKDVLVYPGENGKEDKRSIRFELDSHWFKKTYEFKGREIVDSRTFTWRIAEINPLLCTYNVNSDWLQKLVRYLSEQNNKIKETVVISKKWYLSKYKIWVFDNWIYSEEEKKFFSYTLEDELVCELWNIKILFKWDVRYKVNYEKDYYNEDILDDIISDSEYIFNGNQWHFVLGYFISCLFFHKLKIELTPFPILFVAGKKWSWKTTAVQMFMQCFGYDHLLPESFEKSTPFVDQSDISELSALPLWRDEYKNNQSCTKKDWFLKTVFDRSWISKWRIDLTKVHLPINCPLILSWEELPNDNAVFSRICSINVKTDRWDGNYDEIKWRSDYYWTFLVYLLANIEKLQKIYEKNFIEVKKILIEQKVEKRLLNIYLPIITWITSYQNLLFWEVFSIKQEIIEDYLKIIQSKQKEEDDTDVVNNFFNSIHMSYQSYELQENEWHLVIKWADITINFAYLYSVYSKNEARNRRDPINQQSLRKYIMSELNWHDNRFYSAWSQKRWIKLFNNWKFEALNDLIDFIRSKKDEFKLDININK